VIGKRSGTPIAKPVVTISAASRTCGAGCQTKVADQVVDLRQICKSACRGV
jgi:hypothetical protein